MSTVDKITKITDRAGTGAPNFTNGFTIAGVDSGLTVFTHTEGNTEPSSPSNGDTWWDTDNDIYYVRMNDEWKNWLGTAASTLWYGDKAAYHGFYNTTSNSIHTFDISTTGNASDWKDLTRTTSTKAAACSNGTYGLHCGGVANGGESGDVNNIDYYAFANNTNATDFGDLTTTSHENSACSDGTTGCIQIGNSTASTNLKAINNIDYVTIATPGNASDFGDVTAARRPAGNIQISNGTRGVFAGGWLARTSSGAADVYTNVIDYITIATPGNATDFGDMVTAGNRGAGVGSGETDRGLIICGRPSGRYRTIEYVTISTTGNATDFGDIFVGSSSGWNYDLASCNNATRAVAMSATTNNMEYVTMSTTGNASDFGDQVGTVNRYNAATSGSGS